MAASNFDLWQCKLKQGLELLAANNLLWSIKISIESAHYTPVDMLQDKYLVNGSNRRKRTEAKRAYR
nr:hypothetical protein [Tanacetum cinerariifolium]